MNRPLRTVLFVIAVLLAIYSALLANYFHVAGVSVGHSKMVWLTALGAAFFGLAGWRFSLRAKFRIFVLLLTCFVVELLLQAAAWSGVLPIVNTKLRAPYGRVYWSGEGRGNAIRNRFGWYYPPFDLKATRRIAVVGDSQVEAVEVSPRRNQAAVLQTLFRERSADVSVLGLGCHGTSPAYSIDVLEYAARHFQPQEAVVVISLGSDITEASPALNGVPPEAFITYEIGPEGKLVLDPRSNVAREDFIRNLELSHRSVFANLPMTLNSHCMTLQFANSVRDNFTRRRRQAELAVRAAKMPAEERAEYERIGFNAAPFAVNPQPEVQLAMAVLLGQLRRCQDVCKQHGMLMRVVTVPAFPKAFYDSQHGSEWTMKIGNYDYLKPEREIADFARTNGIPCLAMGEYIHNRKLDVEEIRSMYFAGVGHLTEKGHRFWAQAMFDTFYQTTRP